MSQAEKRLTLSKAEMEFLVAMGLLPKAVGESIQDNQQPKSADYCSTLNARDALELRDELINRIAVSGFDENYELNEEGKTLEKLIDRIWLLLGPSSSPA